MSMCRRLLSGLTGDRSCFVAKPQDGSKRRRAKSGHMLLAKALRHTFKDKGWCILVANCLLWSALRLGAASAPCIHYFGPDAVVLALGTLRFLATAGNSNQLGF